MTSMAASHPGKSDEPEHAPLTAAVFNILLALADGEKHGYAIMREVDEATQGAVTMGPGTLYGSLERMQKAGLIAEVEPKRRADDDDSRRRYYALTDGGLRVCRAEVLRLERAVRAARAKKLLLLT